MGIHPTVFSWGICTVGVLHQYVQYFEISFAKLAKASSPLHTCKTKTHWFIFLQAGVQGHMSSCLSITAPCSNLKDDESSSCTSTLLYHHSIPLFIVVIICLIFFLSKNFFDTEKDPNTFILSKKKKKNTSSKKFHYSSVFRTSAGRMWRSVQYLFWNNIKMLYLEQLQSVNAICSVSFSNSKPTDEVTRLFMSKQYLKIK